MVALSMAARVDAEGVAALHRTMPAREASRACGYASLGRSREEAALRGQARQDSDRR